LKFRSLEKTNINCPIIGFGAAPLGDLFQNLSEKKAQKLLQQAQSHSKYSITNINFKKIYKNLLNY
jgi:hypothetical protein